MPLDGTPNRDARDRHAKDADHASASTGRKASGGTSSPSTMRLTARMKARLFAWRNAVLSSSRFQAWAARFPFTRPIANGRASQLFDLCAGFVYTQILCACVELDLFTFLSSRPRTVQEVASTMELSRDAAERLLDAAESLGLAIALDEETYMLGHQGAALLGNPSVFDMIKHHRLLYLDLADPVALLRGKRGETALGSFWGYAQRGEGDAPPVGDAAAYSALMASTQAFVTEEILTAVHVDRFDHIMDVGGGQGAFLSAVAKEAPGAKLTLVDLPAVIPLARARLEQQGLGGRMRPVGCDVAREPLPVGADLITLVRILHDHEDDMARVFLRRAYEALSRRGTLMIAEPMANTRGAAPMGHAYFGFYLWAMGTGKPRTPERLTVLLREAGFSHVRRIRTHRPILTSVLLAER